MRIRIVTYNIHRAIGLDRQFRPERIVRILEHVDADVVLLQEVDEGVPRSREMDMARSLAEELGYPHFAVGHNVRLAKGRYGNATFSRFPIVRERNIDLTVGGRKRRGCQHTRLALSANPGHLEIFNLHLGLSARERHAQVAVLARSSEFSTLKAETPCLVAGDFNDWRSMLRETFVDGLGFVCASDRGSHYPRAIRTYPSFSPSGALDRIYHRGPLQPLAVRRCSLALTRVASDHRPLIADYDIGKPALS